MTTICRIAPIIFNTHYSLSKIFYSKLSIMCVISIPNKEPHDAHNNCFMECKSNPRGLDKQDRSRRCQYIQSFDIFFILTFFATLTGNDASNRLDIIIFVISRSISVEIDLSLVLFQKFYVWRPFLIFF